MIPTPITFLQFSHSEHRPSEKLIGMPLQIGIPGIGTAMGWECGDSRKGGSFGTEMCELHMYSFFFFAFLFAFCEL